MGAKALKPLWKGPYVVVWAHPPLYKLQDRRKVGVWHHDKLKVCRDRQIPLWLRRLRNSILSQEEGEEELEETEPATEGFDILEKDWQDGNQPAPEADVQADVPDPEDQPVLDEVSDGLAENDDNTGAGLQEAVEPAVEPTTASTITKRSRTGRVIQRPSYLKEYELD